MNGKFLLESHLISYAVFFSSHFHLCCGVWVLQNLVWCSNILIFKTYVNQFWNIIENRYCVSKDGNFGDELGMKFLTRKLLQLIYGFYTWPEEDCSKFHSSSSTDSKAEQSLKCISNWLGSPALRNSWIRMQFCY